MKSNYLLLLQIEENSDKLESIKRQGIDENKIRLFKSGRSFPDSNERHIIAEQLGISDRVYDSIVENAQEMKATKNRSDLFRLLTFITTGLVLMTIIIAVVLTNLLSPRKLSSYLLKKEINSVVLQDRSQKSVQLDAGKSAEFITYMGKALCKPELNECKCAGVYIATLTFTDGSRQSVDSYRSDTGSKRKAFTCESFDAMVSYFITEQSLKLS